MVARTLWWQKQNTLFYGDIFLFQTFKFHKISQKPIIVVLESYYLVNES